MSITYVEVLIQMHGENRETLKFSLKKESGTKQNLRINVINKT